MTNSKNVQNPVKGWKFGPLEFKTEPEYVYATAIILGYFFTIYGLFIFPYTLSKKTILWSEYLKYYFKKKFKNLPPILSLLDLAIGLFAKFGETAGVHRLWSHRTYKAKLPLRIFLLFCYYLTFWVNINNNFQTVEN